MTPTKPMTAEIRTMNASIAAQVKAQMNHVHKCNCAGCEQLEAIASGQHVVIEAGELERLRRGLEIAIEDCGALSAERDRLRKALVAVEFGENDTCPACGGLTGHLDGCTTDAVLNPE